MRIDRKNQLNLTFIKSSLNLYKARTINDNNKPLQPNNNFNSKLANQWWSIVTTCNNS